MSILPAGRRLFFPVFLFIIAILLQWATKAAAVMPPSTCLQESVPVASTTSNVTTGDTRQQITERIHQNEERVEEIELENRALSKQLENLPADKTSGETRS